jgi:hypothetical protein
MGGWHRIFGPLLKADEWRLCDSPDTRAKMGNRMFQVLHIQGFLSAGRLAAGLYGVIPDHPNPPEPIPAES